MSEKHYVVREEQPSLHRKELVRAVPILAAAVPILLGVILLLLPSDSTVVMVVAPLCIVACLVAALLIPYDRRARWRMRWTERECPKCKKAGKQ